MKVIGHDTDDGVCTEKELIIKLPEVNQTIYMTAVGVHHLKLPCRKYNQECHLVCKNLYILCCSAAT